MLYEKSTCQFQIKFITDNYLQMLKHKYLQTHLHLIQINLQAKRLLKTHMYIHKII
jgi:hypothetical protein